MKLYGHVIRADYEDPMKEVTFEQFANEANGMNNKRPGKPRQNWTEESVREAYEKLDLPEKKDAEGTTLNYKTNKRLAKSIVTKAAKDRTQIFDTTKKQHNPSNTEATKGKGKGKIVETQRTKGKGKGKEEHAYYEREIRNTLRELNALDQTLRRNRRGWTYDRPERDRPPNRPPPQTDQDILDTLKELEQLAQTLDRS